MSTTKSQSLIDDAKFLSAIYGLQSFVLDTNADLDAAYDWICDIAECDTFVADDQAWDIFYDTYQYAVS
tara:strand:+ start:55716 stop:55922 length:207 start_codon:yes stop_codon:yes gene_type:complete